MIYDPYPFKRCTKCLQEFPRTLEYFPRDKAAPGNMRADCRLCHRKQSLKWQKENPEKANRRTKTYRNNHPDKERERQRRWVNENPEKARDKGARYFARHPGRRKEIQDRQKLLHPDKARGYQSRWTKANPEKVKAKNHRRRAKLLGFAFDFDAQHWQYALDYFDGRCAACGRPPGLWHTLAMDHWIPLNNPDCPGTVPWNIVPLCHGVNGCNNSKADRAAKEWLTDKFGKRKAAKILSKIERYFSTVQKQ